jgi:hypothetical protein
VAWELQGKAEPLHTMSTIFQHTSRSLVRPSAKNLFRSVSLLATALTLSSFALAQTAAPTPAPAAAPAADATPADNTQQRGRGNRGNFSPEEMRARMMDAIKEQLGVASDEEWAVISPRVTAVMELRQAAGGRGGMMAFRGMMGGPGGNNQNGQQNGQNGRANRPGRFGPNNPEMDALQTAITDKAPDAEVKARLERLREVRKENDAKMTKAQEELRAVLSVRQEAVAVLYGLLP